MARTSSAPGKLILCGEYAVVFGYPGIAIPAPLTVNVTFTEDTSLDDLQVDWNEGQHLEWNAYVEKIIAECRTYAELPSGTLEIENSIPLGSGMGSSTAFVVAICKVLLGENCLEQAKKVEDAMSPGHSGIDFEVIWGNSPIVFSKEEGSEPVELPNNMLRDAFLIDTGTPNETTSELIAYITKQKEESEEVEEALRTIGHCTERILNNEDILSIFRKHNQAQVTLGVVTKPVQQLIADIESKGGAAKVVGAGSRSGGNGIVLALGIESSVVTSYPVVAL